MTRIRRHLFAILTAALLIFGAAGALAVTAQPAQAWTGVCTVLQAGEYRWVNGRLYQCVYVKYLGWLWIQAGVFYGCAAPRHVARLC